MSCASSSLTKNKQAALSEQSHSSIDTGTTGEMRAVHLYFLFAQVDHWVAERTRDALIRARAYDSTVDGDRKIGRGRRKPHMEVDNQIGMGHAFCLSTSCFRRSQGLALISG